MIEVVSIFEDCRDAISFDQNGDLTMSMFNRFSRRAELRIVDWLKGDPAGNLPPEPWTTQTLKDFLAPFIVKVEKNMSSDGLLARPDDYYRFEDFRRKGSVVEVSSDCESHEEEEVDDRETIIELLDAGAFSQRSNTWIDGDKPSLKKPIAKQYSKVFETYPKDLGPVVLEYIRYPKFASIKKTIDPVYNTPVFASVNDYEWDEWAREPLIWFITDFFANRTSNKSMKEFNQVTKKTVRE